MHKTRILIVEDEAIVGQDLNNQLTGLGYEAVAQTTTGEEALILVEKLRPEVVIMDVRLAGSMDGITTANAIREQFSIPVVFLTAFHEDATIERAKDSMPYGYLTKPFQLTELRMVIDLAFVRHKAEIQMRQANDERVTILKTAMDGFLMMDLQARFLEVNDAYCQMTGYTREELLQMSIADMDTDKSMEEIAAHINQIKQTGCDRFERRHRRKDGGIIEFEVSVNRLMTSEGRLFCFLRDITERKAREAEIERLNRLYLALSQVNQLITRVKTREALLAGICQMLVQYGQLKLAWIGWLDPQTRMVIRVAHYGEMGGFLDQIKVCADESRDGLCPTGKAVSEAHTVVCNDFMHDDVTESWREAATLLGFGSCASFPIRVDGLVCGALSLYAGEPGFFRDKEILLFEEAAVDVSFALDNIEKDRQKQQAEAAMRTSEEHYRTLFDYAPDGVLIADPKSFYIDANASICQMLGYTHDELIGLHASDIVMQTEIPQIEQALTAIQSNSDYHREWRFRRKNGSNFTAEVIATKLPDGNLLGLIRDITERKQAETALNKSEKMYRSLFENMLNGFAYCRIQLEDGKAQDFIYLAVNAAFESLTGLKNVIGKKVTEVIPGIRETDPRLFEIFGRVAMTGQPERFEMFVEALHSWFWISVYSPATEYFVVVFDVITTRKEAEVQIQRLSRAVEQSCVCILITDSKGAIEYVNPKFTQLTGYTQDEMHGQNPRILKGNGTSAEEYRRLWQTITAGQEWRGEFHNRKKNGDLFWESASISPIIDADGHITQFLAVKTDISERKVLEEQLRQAQKLESIGQLAGGVAHDFNNIISVAMIRLSIMQQINLSPEMREMVLELTEDIKRAANLTRQLLMFSRRSAMEVKVLDLNELVTHLLKMLRRLIGEHIEVRFNCRDFLPFIEADAMLLEQVVMNLTLNARDAMSNGGKLTISIENIQFDEDKAKGNIKLRQGQYVCLSIADTGYGMDETTQKRIFEPFFTTKEPGKGTGLGLATVHGIVAQHKGWVDVESALGKGTTFKVFLPTTTKGRIGPIQPENISSIRCYETILCVEDEENLRHVVVLGLRTLGYCVLEADNGTAAMKLWQEQGQQIDLLFTDMVIPDGPSGLDLAEKFKAEKPNLMVIITSGYLMDKVNQIRLTAGGFLYLQKPYEIKELSKSIRDCLDRE